ncbi:hypothetical protein ANCDUO_03614 [Ancylostoma duodenale]|uniref:Uncharacterized protein n=1 Tax=Ancylostoma duodenale TaxID=51022 RepID=A0A0C2D8K9_9BILA|nr:hypothetical protein ANCDUO_03614 [Ancylostoma duodenale]
MAHTSQDLEEIREIGARHVLLKQECGLGTAELDKFQEIFVEVILKQDGVRQSKEASRVKHHLLGIDNPIKEGEQKSRMVSDRPHGILDG